MISASAQPTIDFSNWDPAGQSLTMYMVTDPGTVQPPSPGMDQTWDFSSAVFAEAGAALIAPAAGTPYAATYPMANYVYAVTLTGQPTVYNYMVVNNTSVQNMATNVPIATNDYSDYNQILQFPFAYGQSFTDAYASTNNTGSSTWMFAGYGTLITSLGAYMDQIMLFDNVSDDVVMWNPDPIFPRLIGNSSGVSLFLPGPVGMNENGATPVLGTFPNPARTTITVIGSEGHSTWTIIDLQGRELLSGNWAATSDRTINIEGLSAGQYMLISNGANGPVAKPFVKG